MDRGASAVMPTRPPTVWNPVDKLDPGGQASAHRPTAWILVFRRSIPLDVKFGLSREETFDAAVTGCTRAYVWWWSSFVVLQFQRTARLNRIGPRPTTFFFFASIPRSTRYAGTPDGDVGVGRHCGAKAGRRLGDRSNCGNW